LRQQQQQQKQGGGFKHFKFSSLPGEVIQFDQYVSIGLKTPPIDDDRGAALRGARRDRNY